VSFAAITLCVASQRVFIFVISLSTQSGNFWIHPPIVATVKVKIAYFVTEEAFFFVIRTGILTLQWSPVILDRIT
jgi:hypothetical protein